MAAHASMMECFISWWLALHTRTYTRFCTSFSFFYF